MVNSPDDSSEKMSPRVRVRVSLEFASKGPFNVCLKLFTFSIFQYDAHLEFRFPERREEHDGGVAHLCTVDGTDQREGYCAWAP